MRAQEQLPRNKRAQQRDHKLLETHSFTLISSWHLDNHIADGDAGNA
jgi:hypothetical protein